MDKKIEKKNIKHYALIPAKAKSSRCINKNWRSFYFRDNLVKYLIKNMPQSIFDLIILSTDKTIAHSQKNIILHHRCAALASTESPINNLISVIIKEYNLDKEGYIWLLNPTSPFRVKKDFYKIRKIITEERPGSIVSVTKIKPVIWKNLKPLFDTSYPRQNIQDFKVDYHVENGQFFVIKIRDFLKTKTWYTGKTLLYKQSSIKSMVDIDTEEDFLEAQNICKNG